MKLFFVVLVVAVCQLAECKELKREFILKTGSLPLKITFPLYTSGREDPTWQVGSDNANYARIRELLATARSNGFTYKPERMPSVLGYKGFLVREQTDSSLPLVVGPRTKELQELLLNTVPQDVISGTAKTAMLQTIRSGSISAAQAENVEKRACFGMGRTNKNEHGPPFVWNEETETYWNSCNILPYCNCYNYATNIFTEDDFAVPGRTIDVPRDQEFGEVIKQRAARDGLIVIEGTDIPAVRSNIDKNVVALFVIPVTDPSGPEYHWYRLDRNPDTNGAYHWSHKPGRLRATNLDKDDHTITDPRTANSGELNYQFVCFMEVNSKKVIKKIGPKCTSA